MLDGVLHCIVVDAVPLLLRLAGRPAGRLVSSRSLTEAPQRAAIASTPAVSTRNVCPQAEV